MRTLHVILLTLGAAGLASVPAISRDEQPSPRTGTEQDNRIRADLPPGGSLQTMPHGHYQCALPGDAGGAAFNVQEEENFRIFTASRYEDLEGAGTYIMRGRELTFTGGPKKGEMFRRIGDNQLRQLGEDGTRTDLLCTRLGSR